MSPGPTLIHPSDNPPQSPLKLSLPVAMGYVPLGAAFGFLMAQTGASWWIAPLMSLLVYAGAAQFMAVPMFAAGESLTAIGLATLVINLRHVFYGLSLLDRLPRRLLSRMYLAWALTDESYSLVTMMPPGSTPRQILNVVLLNHGWWLLGTCLGNLIGMNVSPALQGFEFSLAALFTILVLSQWRSHRQVMPLITAIVSYTIGWAVAPAHAMPLAIALSTVVCILLSRHQKENSSC
ncbi:MAG: AzlC family ABC transporter permease [Lautropia sp.]|nr:AzlC family ABC transporter permease [Lautropia sp.]